MVDAAHSNFIWRFAHRKNSGIQLFSRYPSFLIPHLKIAISNATQIENHSREH